MVGLSRAIQVMNRLSSVRKLAKPNSQLNSVNGIALCPGIVVDYRSTKAGYGEVSQNMVDFGGGSCVLSINECAYAVSLIGSC